jgi:glycerol-3-phosphate dehydrogenase
MAQEIEADVLIIGGGIAGVSIARELSKYNIKTVLIEKEADISMGISKTGNGYIYTGLEMAYSMVGKGRIETVPGTAEYETARQHLELAKQGFPKAHELLHNLDVGHKHGGCIILARNNEELELLDSFAERARQVHALDSSAVEIIDRDTLYEMEPHITPEAIAAAYDPECIIDFFLPEYVIALAENARDNGVEILVETKVLNISESNGRQIVKTTKGSILTKYIINAAGKYVDRVADMAGARDDWGVHFNRLQMTLFDKQVGKLINNHIRVPVADDMVLSNISPLNDGNLLIFFDRIRLTDDRENRATSKESFNLAFNMAKKVVPCLAEKDVITMWTAIAMGRYAETVIHNVEVSKHNSRFINLSPIMPGIGALPLVAERTVALLGNLGLQLNRNPKSNAIRKGIPKFRELSDDERNKLILEDSRYGRVVCRCETVTEGEIVEAIKRGAKTVQGVSFRTRAGMGRCQRGFCGPQVVKIIARELDIPVTEVTMKGGLSNVVQYRSKELLGTKI